MLPDIPGRISFSKIEGKEYVRYQTDRKYNANKKYNEPERVMIGSSMIAVIEEISGKAILRPQSCQVAEYSGERLRRMIRSSTMSSISRILTA